MPDDVPDQAPVADRPSRGWLIRTLVTALFGMTAIQAMRPMVSYRALELGASAFELGIVAASYALLSFLFAAPLGSWIDRLGEARFLIGGTATTTLIAVVLSQADSLPAVIGAQALLGLGQVTALVALQTLVANGGPRAGRDARFGAFTVAASTTQIIGPMSAGFLYDTAGLSSGRVFLLAGIPAIAAVGMAVSLLVRPAPRSTGRGVGARSPSERFFTTVGTVMRRPSIPHAMLVSVAVLTSIDLLIAYLPAYGEANGIPASTIGVMLGARAAAGMASRVLMLPMLRRSTRRRLLAQSTLLPCVALLLLPLTDVTIVLIGLLAVAGFGLGLGQPLSMAWIADQVPRSIRGTALGIRITGNRLGQFVVPVAVGAVAGATSIAAIFVISGVTLGVSALVMSRAPDGGGTPGEAAAG
ncbi:MAG TPA: MFS transporter [Egicoccus sp.]|nr:MFS transporter [Egicoccus sp.]HSK22939.1 MFS transporter [Egicoccus sp.]